MYLYFFYFFLLLKNILDFCNSIQDLTGLQDKQDF
jgi:hypothetical protein